MDKQTNPSETTTAVDAELVAKPNTPAPVPTVQKSKSTNIITVVLVIVALALATIIAYLAVGYFKEDTEANNPEKVVTPTIVAEQDPVVTNATVAQLITDEDTSNDNVTITDDNAYYYFMSNGLADHDTGEFPNAGNPNTISEQDYDYRITKSPKKEVQNTATKIFGISLGGIPFDPGTAETDSATGWRIEAIQSLLNLGLDDNNAHVQPNGAYHYHGIPEALVERDTPAVHSSLIGFAADGFPIYVRYGFSDINDSTSIVLELRSSYQLREGERTDGPAGIYDGTYTEDFEFIDGSGDLDDCNGRFAVTPEYPDGTYAYFLTDQFPYVPRCVYGTPDSSFSPQAEEAMPPAGGQGAPPQL